MDGSGLDVLQGIPEAITAIGWWMAGLSLAGFNTNVAHLQGLRRAFPNHPITFGEFGWSNQSSRNPANSQPVSGELTALYEAAMHAYLRANGFRTYIVSGGGIDFMRPWAEAVYGIPPEQVIGSSVQTKFELRGGKPVLVRLPELHFNVFAATLLLNYL